MNILHVLSNMKKNGPAVVITDLSLEQQKNNNVFIASGGGVLVETLYDSNVTHINIPINRTKSKFHVLFYLKAFFKTKKILSNLIEDFNIEVINAHQPVPILFAWLMKKKYNIRFFVTAHNIFDHKSIKYRLFYKADKVIAVSKKVEKNLLDDFKLNPGKVTTIENGINLSKSLSIEKIDLHELMGFQSDDIIIGTLAGLRKQKKLDDMIEMMSYLTKKAKNYKLVIVGEGEERKYLESLIIKYSLQKYVFMIGYVDDSIAYLKGFDYFCLTSLYEGLPISLLEAMANNIISVCTPVGGVPEVLKDSVNGYIIPVNDPKCAAEKIIKINKGIDNFDEIKKNAYNDIYEKYSDIAMAKKFEKLLKQ